ncbi:hypothetical protein [Solilutibacter pythonis]|uniref:hypothetical protein n=1 Tax=Solilutibacter pythonis TaxID=2483112 RepID=UPI001B86B51A|nr:hypothetical protein [Lysobacter pythonis]
MAKSINEPVGFLGFLRENGFLAMVNYSEGKMIFYDLPPAKFIWSRGKFSDLQMPSLNIPEGYRVVLSFHTHPYRYGTGQLWNQSSVKGPSGADQKFARANPKVFNVIKTLPGDVIYYGPSAFGR